MNVIPAFPAPDMVKLPVAGNKGTRTQLLTLLLRGANSAKARYVDIEYNEQIGSLSVSDGTAGRDARKIAEALSGLAGTAFQDGDQCRIERMLSLSKALQISTDEDWAVITDKEITCGSHNVEAGHFLGAQTGFKICGFLNPEIRWASVQDLRSDLCRTCAGFSIPAFLNGEPICAPHAQTSLHFSDRLYGRYAIDPTGIKGDTLFYLDGLPLLVSPRLLHLQSRSAVVVHLNPDDLQESLGADSVLDLDEVTQSLLVSDIDQFLVGQGFSKPPEYDTPITSLVNKLRSASTPALDLHGMALASYARLPSPMVTPSPLREAPPTSPHGVIRIADDLCWDFGEFQSMAAAYIYSLGCPVLTGDVPSGQATPKGFINPAAETFTVIQRGPRVSRYITDGPFAGYTVNICDSYSIVPNSNPVIPVATSVEAPAVSQCGKVIYMTPLSGRHIDSFLHQIRDYSTSGSRTDQVRLQRDKQAALSLLDGF